MDDRRKLVDNFSEWFFSLRMIQDVIQRSEKMKWQIKSHGLFGLCNMSKIKKRFEQFTQTAFDFICC